MRAIHLPTVDSTMLHARRVLTADGGNTSAPLSVRADQQTGGVGTRGRHWHSPAGGLWLTIAVPLSSPLDPLCALRVALAVHHAATDIVNASFCGQSPSNLFIKWPNDLLVGPEANAPKLAGVLIEALRFSHAPWVLCGIGVNVLNHAPDCSAADPLGGGRAAASLRDVCPGPVPPDALDQLANTLMRAVPPAIDPPADHTRTPASRKRVIDSVRSVLWGVGLTVPITLGDGARVSGRIDGLDDSGNLIATINGQQRSIPSAQQIG